MRDGDVAEAGNRLSRAEAIIDELLTTLDLEQGGVIASRLQGIYVFCCTPPDRGAHRARPRR